MQSMSHSLSVARRPRGSLILPLVGVLWGLAACQTSPPTAPVPTPAASEIDRPAPVPAGAREFRVLPEESLLQILVFRGGAMARMGHNHVIASHQLGGSMFIADDPLLTSLDIRFPVNTLTVDDPVLREAAGADFRPTVPQSARDGTRVNLLSAALLDGAKYPEIRLRATGLRALGDGYEAGIEVTFKDRAWHLRIPVHVQRGAQRVVATGDFPLRQSELGLTPFSVAMGTLVVLDEMRIRFRVVASS